MTLDVRIAPGDIGHVSLSIFTESQKCPGMPLEPRQDPKALRTSKKIMPEVLRASPQDPLRTLLDNFCELFVSAPSFH